MALPLPRCFFRGENMRVFTEIYEYLRAFNAVSVCFRIALTVFLGGIIGTEREHRGKAAGIRTHIFVALGAAMTAMTGIYVSEVYGSDADITRMSAQVISGIGFLGAGTILVRHRLFITGLTTAACIWTTGILGLAVGYGFYEPAILCTVIMPSIAGRVGRLHRKSVQSRKMLSLYAEIRNAARLDATLTEIGKTGLYIRSVRLSRTSSMLPDGVGVTLLVSADTFSKETLERMNGLENVHFAISLTG